MKKYNGLNTIVEGESILESMIKLDVMGFSNVIRLPNHNDYLQLNINSYEAKDFFEKGGSEQRVIRLIMKSMSIDDLNILKLLNNNEEIFIVLPFITKDPDKYEFRKHDLINRLYSWHLIHKRTMNNMINTSSDFLSCTSCNSRSYKHNLLEPECPICNSAFKLKASKEYVEEKCRAKKYLRKEEISWHDEKINEHGSVMLIKLKELIQVYIGQFKSK